MSSPWNRMRAGGDLVLGIGEERVGQRGLARAVRAHQGVHLAGLHHEVDTPQDLGDIALVAGRTDVEAVDAQEVGCHGTSVISTTAIGEIVGSESRARMSQKGPSGPLSGSLCGPMEIHSEASASQPLGLGWAPGQGPGRPCVACPRRGCGR